MVVFGGADGVGGTLNDVHLYTFETQQWKKIDATGDIPLPRVDHSSSITPDGSSIIIFGGVYKSWFNDVHKLDLATWTWQKLSTSGIPPIPRSTHVSVITDNQLIIFGGLKSYMADGYLNSVHQLNLNTLAWREYDPDFSPLSRSKPTAVLSPDGGSMIVFGGRTSNLFLNDLFSFDLKEESWTRLDPEGEEIPSARNAHVAVLVKDRMFVFGGYNDQLGVLGNGYLNQLAEFQF